MNLLNMRMKRMNCDCPAHCGDLVTQIEGELPNGKKVAIMQDWRGLHVSIGAKNAIGQWQYTPPVSEAEAEQIIREAMQS